MKRFGKAVWQGGVRDGSGAISTESGALNNAPYAFFSRFGDEPGTNPEELIGAAHAGCFCMAFSRLLGLSGFTPTQLDARSEVSIEKQGEGFAITAVHLTVVARIPGISQSAFETLAHKAKEGCPVSAVLRAPITFSATLAA
ncbi:OsmC family protein [Pseudoxanthobacter sp.]|uniref:OsmC family protein n=1 Tax=Pseudoxanthobacter sp. TaxID=1925742 RepID=UPI002FDFBD34